MNKRKAWRRARPSRFSQCRFQGVLIKKMDTGENRLGVEELLYRSVGGVCAAMALRSPWPRASISGSCRMPLRSSM